MSENIFFILEFDAPAPQKMCEAGDLAVDFVDVFHEQGVFETEESREILTAARKLGFALNFHGDELHPVGSAELAAEVGAHAVSHCEEISAEGIQQMATHKIAAVLLPTTAYLLRLTPPPAREMIEAGVPVALGSDFNPNAHGLSMPLVMNLACVLMRMTMKEALVASTINAAGFVPLPLKASFQFFGCSGETLQW